MAAKSGYQARPSTVLGIAQYLAGKSRQYRAMNAVSDVGEKRKKEMDEINNL